MATRTNGTPKNASKAWNAIVRETQTLNQVLKSFGGLLSKKLDGLDGLTVGEFMTLYGIEHKNGKVAVSGIRKAWASGMIVDNKMGIFMGVKGEWLPKEGDDLYEKNQRAFYVCTKEEAEKYVKTGECELFKLYKVVPVDDYAWSTKVISRGMQQTAKYDKESDKAITSELAWEDLKEVYITYEVRKENGELVERKMRKVSKDEVTF